MPYIDREDGERFVIPSYRDVLSEKKSNLLKKEILLLSENYGSYATIIKKNAQQYEVAFSPDAGYLLGETVWQYFKRPFDLIYCEAIPNTKEAILVILKSGSVFLDGSFPVDSILEELIVFQTQQNNFEIYIYGDVPISQTSEEGKFSFDPSHVKSFNVLDEPVFPKLPKIRAFQFQPVNIALKMQGVDVVPIKAILVFLIVLGLIWMGWNYLISSKEEFPRVVVTRINPYQYYLNTLASPAPHLEIKKLVDQIMLFFSIPGWIPDSLEYGKGKLNVAVKSLGAKTDSLLRWAKNNKFQVEVQPDGFHLIQTTLFLDRIAPNKINQLDEVVASLVDKLSIVLPGNNLTVNQFINKGQYKEGRLVININNITINTLDLVGQQLSGLPLVLTKISFNFSNGYLTGTISLLALGN